MSLQSNVRNAFVFLLAALGAFSAHMALNLFLPSGSAWAEETIQIALKQAFVPSKGYDNNDTVEVILYGYLPNGCYTLGESNVERENDHHFHVRQFAHRNREGVCAEDASIPPAMRAQVPFTTEARVGKLAVGQYAFSFLSRDRGIRSRDFEVESAISPTVDEAPYAPVSSIHIRSVVPWNERGEVILGGLLTQSCLEVKPQVETRVLDDVVVALPTLSVSDGECKSVEKAFELHVTLPRLGQGRYLLHVRSQNGKSMNRVFQVGKPD